MQFGAQLSNYGTTWADIQSTATTLEAGRWHSLWFSDHFMPPGNPKAGHGPALEGWTLLTPRRPSRIDCASACSLPGTRTGARRFSPRCAQRWTTFRADA